MSCKIQDYNDEISLLEKIETITARVAAWIRNAKTIIVVTAGAIVIVTAIVNGYGREALCDAYFNITGESPEHWQPLEQQWSDAWLSVEDVLQRDPQQQSVTTENVETQKISSTHYRFRWVADDTYKWVDVDQDSSGVWIVNTLPDKNPGWCG